MVTLLSAVKNYASLLLDDQRLVDDEFGCIVNALTAFVPGNKQLMAADPLASSRIVTAGREQSDKDRPL